MSTIDNPSDSRDARTLLWMSPEDFAQIGETPLLVVGSGGTGSLLAVEAAYVGFRNIIICEADGLERSNLNRFIYATEDDIGRLKAEIVSDYLRVHAPYVRVTVIPEAFPSVAALEILANSSPLVAGCVDDTRVRIELNVACRRFSLTLVDLGTGFVRKDGKIVSAGGQVLVSRPGGPCLMCLGFTHLMNENDYMVGPDYSPQPSLLLLNTVVSSLAVECLLNEASGVETDFNAIEYSRRDVKVWTRTFESQPTCRICGVGSERHIESVIPGFLRGEE